MGGGGEWRSTMSSVRPTIRIPLRIPLLVNTFFFFNVWSYCLSEKAMAPHSSTLAWKIPWTEDPGRLLSMGLWRVGHDWATSLWLFTFMHWRRKWQATPVFLPGESQGRGESGGLPSMGSHRVRHDWSDLAAAAVAAAAAAAIIFKHQTHPSTCILCFGMLDLLKTHLFLCC